MTDTPNYTKKYFDNRTASGRVHLEAAAFVPAELVSMSVSLGVVAIADTVAPGMIKDMSHALGKYVFEPYLDYIEGGINSVCRLEQCKIDTSKPREERAEALAHTTLVFGAAWAASMIAKMETRRFLNNMTGVSEEAVAGKKWWQFWKMTNHEKVIFGLDEGVHYGSMLLMNTAGAPVTDNMIESSKNILVKCGVPEKKAHEIASMVMIWEVPNFLGMVSGIAGINGIQHHQWDKKFGEWLEKNSLCMSRKKPAASFVEQVTHSAAHTDAAKAIS